MAFFDMSEEELQSYLPPRVEPPDFDAFWQTTLSETRTQPLAAEFTAVDCGLTTLEVFDVSYNGFGGQPIKAWLKMPKVRSGKLPCVVEYVGYGGGRGSPLNELMWSSAGYAHLLMDTRGQGSVWSTGDTADNFQAGNGPHHPGFLTLGIQSPQSYYYRRVFTDAVRAVEAVRTHPQIDQNKIIITGASQGGGITLAVAGLVPNLAAVMTDVPFLCHFRRATEISDSNPYSEIVSYCRIHRQKIELVFETLSYFDGVNFAARANTPALFSTALMDDVCPPSTVFAAYNHYQGPKEIKTYTYNQHDGGGIDHCKEKIAFLKKLCQTKQ